MMTLFFGQITCPVHEIEGFTEIREDEILLDVVLLNDVPVRQPVFILAQSVTPQRKNTSTAWYTLFVRQVSYSRSTHTSLSRTSIAYFCFCC